MARKPPACPAGNENGGVKAPLESHRFLASLVRRVMPKALYTSYAYRAFRAATRMVGGPLLELLRPGTMVTVEQVWEAYESTYDALVATHLRRPDCIVEAIEAGESFGVPAGREPPEASLE